MRFGFRLGLGTMRSATGAPADPIAALYGTGLRQVPLHLDTAQPVMVDNVPTSVPNLGGTGGSATVVGSASVAWDGNNRLAFPAANTTRYLRTSTIVNLRGTRLFMVMAMEAATATGGLVPTFGGRSTSATDEAGRMNLRINASNGIINLQRLNAGGSTYDTGLAATSLNSTTLQAIHLYEIEFTDAGSAVFIDGVPGGTSALVFADFPVDRFYGGHTTPFWSGSAGDVVVLNGSGASEIAIIRAALATKHGITLA